jgi:type IV secretion system protein VirB3
VAGATVAGIGGALFGAIFVPVFIFMRQTCETDDQAIRIAALEAKCWFARKNANLFGNTLTLSPIQFGRRKHVYKRHFDESAFH